MGNRLKAAESSRQGTQEQGLREALTMALYVSLVLSAEFVAVDGHLDSEWFALSVIWGTALGLTLAHIFAFNLSTLLFSGGRFESDALVAISVQVGATATVAAVLSIPFLVLRLSEAIDLDRYLVAGFIGVIGYSVARTAGWVGLRAMAVGLVMLALAMIVVLAKAGLATH